jgi:hypothetical protein
MVAYGSGVAGGVGRPGKLLGTVRMATVTLNLDRRSSSFAIWAAVLAVFSCLTFAGRMGTFLVFCHKISSPLDSFQTKRLHLGT